MTTQRTLGKKALIAIAVGLLLLMGWGLRDRATTQQLFVGTTYYFLMLTVSCWAGVYLHSARRLTPQALLDWARENWPGISIALLVTLFAGLAIEPALRVLSDEANLVGTSKNFFALREPTFTVSGKNYYGSYWDVDVAIDRRPTLFPFLVSLLHAIGGYAHQNAFHLNLLLLPAFVLVAYRLAKSIGGETFGVVAALFVAAHPITLISARSAGFDFLAVFLGLLVLKSLYDFLLDRLTSLAIVWLNLCMLAEVRYESALFIVPVLGCLLLFKLVQLSSLEPYGLIYALTPAYLTPRVWQSALRGNVPEQEPGTVTFSLENFINNLHEYFLPILNPNGAYSAHSVVLIVLGVVGCGLCLKWLVNRLRARDWQAAEQRFALIVAAWMSLQVVVVFSYVWGRAQFPSAARLLIPIDVFLSFAAAWVVAHGLKRWPPLVAVLVAGAILTTQLPVAAQHRLMNRLTQSRENASTWAFFERLGDKRILIVSDRPSHFTIMNYGAMTFESARRDPYLFVALERRLFQDVYVIQQIQLSTKKPLPGFEFWSDRELRTVFEFQNDANVLVRVSRVVR